MTMLELAKIPAITAIQRAVKKVDLEKGHHFFDVFWLETWVVTGFVPLLFLIPSYLLFMAFHVSSALIGITLCILALIIMAPWIILPAWFLLLKTKPHTRNRKLAYSWLGFTYLSIIAWIIKFNL